MFCCDGMRTLVLGGLLIFGLGLLITCGGETPPPVDPGPADQAYSLRGKVVSLPDDNNKEISIYHEAIPDFIGATGEIVGMDSMTMPFAVDPGESLEGIEEGDKIAFELDVRWEGDELITVRQLKKLSAETMLTFEQPAEGEGEGSTDGEAMGDETGTEETETNDHHDQHGASENS